MESYASLGYAIIGFVHFLGFIFYLSILKFAFKKSIPFRMVTWYVLGWLIVLAIISFGFLITVWDQLLYPVESMFATIGELFGLGIGFLIVDSILWFIGKWLYKTTHKTTVASEDKCKKKFDKKTKVTLVILIIIICIAFVLLTGILLGFIR